jgi:hypothetical protein
MRFAVPVPRLLFSFGVIAIASADIVMSLVFASLILHFVTYHPFSIGLRDFDFSRFWFVGRHFAIDFAQYWGLTAPPAAPAGLVSTNILSMTQAPLQAWLYPPPVNLVGMLVQFLPPLTSYVVWNLTSLVIATALLCWAGIPWPAALMAVAGPVTALDLFAGQFGLLVGAFMVASLLLADTRPQLAGALACGLWLKPHLGLAMIGLAFSWRPRFLAASILSLGGLALLSLLVEGSTIWIWFFTTSMPVAHRLISGAFLPSLAGSSFSVFWCVRSFGASVPLAWIIQAASSLAALILVVIAWRQPNANSCARMAYTICLGTLMTPYGFSFDLIGFSMAMAAMVAAHQRVRWLFSLLWLAPGLTVFVYIGTGHLFFPFVAIYAAWLCHRMAQPRASAAV